MKIKLLLILIVVVVISCKKGDIHPNNSLFGTYTYYTKEYSEESLILCDNPQELEITRASETGIYIFSTAELPFDYEENGVSVYEFETDPGNANYGQVYTLWHFPCSDSIVYSEYDLYYGGGKTIYGKKINGATCSDATMVANEFEPLLCDQWPGNRFCYSSVNNKFNYAVPETTMNQIYYLSVDSLNQNIEIGPTYNWRFTIPTDSSFSLLPGEYCMGQVPATADSILNFSIDLDTPDYYAYYGFYKEGCLNVSESDGIYTISFDILACEASHWTGFYQGTID